MTNAQASNATIMIVDDDDIDIRSIQRALDKGGVSNPRVVAHDGIDALETLRGRGNDEIHWPWLVLLDINMPRMSGLEFLEELRNDPALADTVVFVLSTSDDENDLARAYRYNIAGYVLKTTDGARLDSLVSMLTSYLQAVRFHARQAANPGESR